MDCFSVINSNAIRNHLLQNEYEFNSMEAAWLVYFSNKLSYYEKKEYWNEIINTMPDIEVKKRYNCAGWESLHEFLKQYIAITENEIRDFYCAKPYGEYVYMYSYICKGDPNWSEEFDTVYSSTGKCMDALNAEINDLCNEQGESDVVRYRLKRQALENADDVMVIECLPNNKVCKVIINTMRTSEDAKVIEESFEGMWFDFPTPFTAGDIVWDPTVNSKEGFCKGAFVLKGLSTWNPTKDMRDNADNYDMNGYG